MFLSNASVRRPIAMGCVIIAFSLLGFNSYRKMNVELMPKMDLPYITIVTVYPGASPEEIETDIAKRIEDAVGSIDGLKHVDSSCMENVCQTLLEFKLGTDVDIIATDVREKLDLIRADFPEDVEDPKIVKFDINAKAIITMALTGDVSIDELYDFADNKLRDQITTISGVADVQLVGGAEREVHVLPDRQALAARGLSTMDIYRTIKEGLRTIPSGRVSDSGTEYSVKFDADVENIADIGNLELVNKSGQRCRIKDVGRVTMTTKELRQKSFIDGRPCITIKVIKKAEGNAVVVTRLVKEAMDQLKKEMPGGMGLIWVTDAGRFTEATISSAWSNVFMGVLLTAGVLFLFLYNIRSLIVVCITMPITIVIGLFIMHMAGMTLNTSTMIAVGMSVGVLVTNSIVVLEAIVKRLDKLGNVKEASRLGASEAFLAVLASAGTNIVVLFPLANMPSLIGMFIAPLVISMLIMTGVSLFISFTLTPLLCSVILKPRKENSRSLLARMERTWNRGFDWVLSIYRTILTFNESHRWASILVLLAILGCLAHSFWLLGSLGTSMVEESDRGEIYIKMEFPTRYNLDKSVLRVDQAVDRLKGLPELHHTLSMIGKAEGIIGQASEGVYLAQIALKFSDRDERSLTLDDLMKEVRSRLADYPEAIVTVSVPTPVGGQGSDVEMIIAGDDLKTLDALALQTQKLTRDLPW
ncbi:MAG TPA: efflux RND transporter permease subunit, partial [Phycisphaerae bacterium]|nr:efflux RND transporter permease subunit [Phycisphaerae bacterium]